MVLCAIQFVVFVGTFLGDHLIPPFRKRTIHLYTHGQELRADMSTWCCEPPSSRQTMRRRQEPFLQPVIVCITKQDVAANRPDSVVTSAIVQYVFLFPPHILSLPAVRNCRPQRP